MMKWTRTIALAALAILATSFASPASAAVITFEGYPSGTSITNQYDAIGADFTNAFVLQSPFYNFTGYPPHSGVNVIYSGSFNTTRVDAVGSLWNSAGAWYTSTNPFFLEAYNSSNNLIATAAGSPNYGTNSFLDVSAPNIAYVIFHDHGNFFTLDDFTFQQTSPVPEPASVALFGIGALGLIAFYHRRQLALL